MISRRILRIKVMQLMYAHFISEGNQEQHLQTQLDQRIDKTKQLYFIYLQYMLKISEYALVDAAKRANKFIKKDEDVNVNTDIATNQINTLLQENEEYKRLIKEYNINAFINKNLVKKLFKLLSNKEKYVNYCEISDKSKTDDADINRYIIRRIIGSDEVLDEELAEKFANIEDDHFVCLQSLQKIIKDYPKDSEENFIHKILLLEGEDEEIKFSKSLINNLLNNEEEINSIIEPRLKNWDIDRVSLTDIILLKLAITEFLYFPYIPLKVSLNEYIDISKDYSTEKSKDFINGILDKVMKDLNSEGKIKKLGRGLINN